MSLYSDFGMRGGDTSITKDPPQLPPSVPPLSGGGQKPCKEGVPNGLVIG